MASVAGRSIILVGDIKGDEICHKIIFSLKITRSVRF